MSALVLRLKEPPPQRCDLSCLTAERLAVANEPVERLPINTTRRKLFIGDLFAVTPGDPADIVLDGGSERFDRIGAGMKGGRIRITGEVGQQAGRGMTGGALTVEGNAGRLVGSNMSGGRIEVHGNAGDLVGAPLPGEASGLTGGVIRIHGSAGARAGDRMRRGLISIEGDGGDNLASRMFGGTIVCFGRAGALPGYLMSRGTLLIAGGAGALSPTFIDTGAYEMVALSLIARWLVREGIDAGDLIERPLRRLLGDTAVLGKGEIFLPE